MDAALRRYYRRTEAEMAYTDMPFSELMKEREPGEPEPMEEEDPVAVMRIRVQTIRTLFRYLLAEGPHPCKLMKRMFAVGRGLDIEPFSALTMTEAAMMFSETKAAHSWRMKVLSGVIELAGMHGSRLPGQKSKTATPNYQAAQRGNQNRRKVKDRRAKKPKQNDQ